MELGIIGTLAYLGNNYYNIKEDNNDNILNNYNHNIDFTYHDDSHKKNIIKIKII